MTKRGSGIGGGGMPCVVVLNDVDGGRPGALPGSGRIGGGRPGALPGSGRIGGGGPVTGIDSMRPRAGGAGLRGGVGGGADGWRGGNVGGGGPAWRVGG